MFKIRERLWFLYPLNHMRVCTILSHHFLTRVGIVLVRNEYMYIRIQST